MWCADGIANGGCRGRGFVRGQQRGCRLLLYVPAGSFAARSYRTVAGVARAVFASICALLFAPHSLGGTHAEPVYLVGAMLTAQSGTSDQVSIDGWRAQALEQVPAVLSADIDGATAASLLAAARAADARGDIATAQRLFERVVARGPASHAAMEARRRLGEIYRGEPESAAGVDDALARPAVVRARLGDILPSPLQAPAATGWVDPSDGYAGKAQLNASRAGRAHSAGDLNRGTAAVAQEAAVAAPFGESGAADIAAQQPWRPRARRSHRFEQLLRIDVGDRVFFGVTSAQIGARARSVLEGQAAWLASYPELYVLVEGHADEPGSEADNDLIARARAETARALLVASGVKADRVDIDVRGRKDRVAVCGSGGCRAQNRRAVIRLMVVLPSRAGERS